MTGHSEMSSEKDSPQTTLLGILPSALDHWHGAKLEGIEPGVHISQIKKAPPASGPVLRLKTSKSN